MDNAAHASHLLLTLFAMFAAAKVMAEIFERLKQPAVAGEILAGVLIGPSLLGWVAPDETTNVLAEIGVIFLLFAVGLETKPAAILKVGKVAGIVAILGVVVPFAAGWGFLMLWGGTGVEAAFLGAAMVATSVGITARVLSGMGMLSQTSSRIILGAAVIDDILGLLVLAGVASFAAGQVKVAELGLTTLLSLGFVAAIAFIGAPLLTRYRGLITKLRVGQAFFAVSATLCLGLALAANSIGVAAIIGAFLAGMALAEATEQEHALHEQVRGVTEFLTPFFLVNIGMQLKLSIFADGNTVLLTLLVTLIAVASKLIACAWGARSLGRRGALQVGVGMVPRGEVGIVVAQIGISLGVVTDKLFGVVLFMAVATTLIAPPLLRPLFRGQAAATD